MKYYCSKCNRGKGFWGWHEQKNQDDNYVPKPRDSSRKRENGGTLQLQLENDTKKALNTLTGGMRYATDEYEPDFQGAERQDLNIMIILGNSYFL